MGKWLSSWGVLLLLAFVWGSSFILMKRSMHIDGVAMFSSWQVAAIRLSAAFLALLPICWKHRKLLFSPLVVPLAIVGWFGNGFPAYLFTLAQTELDSGVVGMMNSLTPLFTFLISVVIFKTGWKTAQLLGISLGLFGAIYMISLTNKGMDGNYYYAFFVVLATLFYAVSVNTIRHKLSELSSVTIASLGLSLAGIPSLIYLITTSPQNTIAMDNGKMAMLYAIILGVVGTALALILFNGLIKREGVLFSASVTYIIPFFAVMWGWIDGESLSFQQIVAGAIVLSGVYLVNRAGPLKILKLR